MFAGELTCISQLEQRARSLEGVPISELERCLGEAATSPSLRRKGKTGALMERVLGAEGGSLRGPDFPKLGVELKTIPVDESGRPRESTFVCTLSLRDADSVDWDHSLARAKLTCVLWVPIVEVGALRRVGRACLWRPTRAQELVLASDYDDLIGMIAIGHIEALNARSGRWLQVRPKAAHGRVKTRVLDDEGRAVWTIPRGFYLRARFTGALLREPDTLLGADPC